MSAAALGGVLFLSFEVAADAVIRIIIIISSRIDTIVKCDGSRAGSHLIRLNT